MVVGDLLDDALTIMTTAAKRAAELFAAGTPLSIKADGTEVTPADIEVETLLRTLIAAKYPDDAVIGEEQDAKPGRTGRRWVLDPINGTSLFARRIPTFNMLLTVEDDGEAVVAVIAYPVTGEVYYASLGCGSWRVTPGTQPERLSVSTTRTMRGATCSTVNIATWHESLLVSEAGGRVTDLAGNDVRSGTGSVLATNGHLHDELLTLVRDRPHDVDARFR